MKEIYVDGYDTVVEFPDETPDAEIQKALASNFPETDDQFVNRIADPATPASAVSFDDFKRYQELKPELSWGDLGNLVVQGAGVAAGELYNGVKSTASLAAQGKLGTLGASVAEGAARGTYDLASLGKRIQDNVTSMLEPYMQESGDAQKDQYNRFLAIKEMDNVREAARRGDATILQRFGIGVDPSMVDTESAEGFSYFLDPTVIGTGGSGKLASMLTRAGAKPAELAGRAAGGLARGISRAESKAAELLKSGTAKVDEMTGGLGKYAIPGSIGAAAYGAGLGATGGAAALAVGAVPALELAEGLFKGFSNSMLNNPTRIGPMRHLAMTAPATLAGKAAGNLKWMDTPLDLAAKGTTGAVIGSAYGAGLGGLAAGWEGAAQGLGAGSVLGAGTAGTMRLAEGVTGRAKVRAEENDYNTWRLTQDKDTQDFLDNNIKTHTDRVQVMDAIQLAQAGVGDQATVRVLSGDDFNTRFPGADGVQVVEGDVPVAYINGRDGNSRVLFHEIFHSMARLDGFDSLVAGISNEIGKMYSPDEINSLIREYESLGKPLKESEGLVTTGDKFAALAEEIGAEYFANYIKGKDSSYLLKGTPFKDALNSITSKFVAGKLDRVYNTFQSEIFKHTHLKQSKGMDRAMNDLIKARRKAYRDVELSADDAIRAYGERDLGDDQIFKELQALGVAGLDNKGRRVMKTKYAIKKDDTALGKEVSDALSQADPTGGMLKNADGSWVGRNFSPAQIEALLNAPGLSDKVKEVIQFIDTIRKAGSDAANVTYAAATYKDKRGKTKYRNLPISNRDALIYGIQVSPVGTMVANILDLSLLKSKIVRKWAGDSRLQRVFGSQEGMYKDALTYINALGGDTPTATVLGSQEKRNLLNKLLGVRNVKGNPEVPEGLFVKEGDHPWRSFRLDRFVKARALESTQAQFSQQAYEKGQANFSPRPDSNTVTEKPLSTASNAKFTTEPGIIRFTPAYHGTPHKVDKFSTEKIGSGEGAQAYGWGLYFTETRAIAERYKRQLTPEIIISGEPMPTYDNFMGDPLGMDLHGAVRRFFELRMAGKGVAEWGPASDRVSDLLGKTRGYFKELLEEFFFKHYNAEPKNIRAGEGSLYKVDLLPKEDEFLLWDEPFKDQPQKVIDAVYRAAEEAGVTQDNYKTILEKNQKLSDAASESFGNAMYKETPEEKAWDEHYKSNEYKAAVLIEKLNRPRDSFGRKPGSWMLASELYRNISRHPKDASSILLKHGVKGIKYKDGFSRGSDNAPTYNYVIFNGDDIKIIQENDVNIDQEVNFSPSRFKPGKTDFLTESDLARFSPAPDNPNASLKDFIGKKVQVLTSDLSTGKDKKVDGITVSFRGGPAYLEMFDGWAFTNEGSAKAFRTRWERDGRPLIGITSMLPNNHLNSKLARRYYAAKWRELVEQGKIAESTVNKHLRAAMKRILKSKPKKDPLTKDQKKLIASVKNYNDFADVFEKIPWKAAPSIYKKLEQKTLPISESRQKSLGIDLDSIANETRDSAYADVGPGHLLAIAEYNGADPVYRPDLNENYQWYVPLKEKAFLNQFHEVTGMTSKKNVANKDGTANTAVLMGAGVVLDKLASGDVRFSPTTTPTKTDQAYLSAVQAGDTATAQKMVDEAARKAGYNVGPVYHGTGDTINRFNPDMTGHGNDQIGSGFYFTSSPEEAKIYETSLLRDPRTGEALSKPGGLGNPNTVKAYLSVKNPIHVKGSNLRDTDVVLTQSQAAEIIKSAPEVMSKEDSPLGDWFPEYWDVGPKEWMIKEVAKNYAGSNLLSLEGDWFRGDSTRFREALNKVTGRDGVVMDFESTPHRQARRHTVAWFPEQIKSAEPITRDDQGNVIPLSERFSQASDDIRFSPIRQLNNRGGAVYNSPTGHRAVQTSSRAGVRVYDSAGKRVGPVFQSVEKAQDWLAKRQ